MQVADLLDAAAGHRPQQLVLLLGRVEHRQDLHHNKQLLTEIDTKTCIKAHKDCELSPQSCSCLVFLLAVLSVLGVGFTDLFDGLRTRRQRLGGVRQERVDGADVSGDGATQRVEQRVEQTLNVVVDDALHRRRAHRDTVDFYFSAKIIYDLIRVHNMQIHVYEIFKNVNNKT